mmetsp:Transcript_29176/g.80081  ORF Transcript_29176/g.80081 Transcript_29176/m.80081 type:complete len:200 (+) Transcript_29176:588-1187(+)
MRQPSDGQPGQGQRAGGADVRGCAQAVAADGEGVPRGPPGGAAACAEVHRGSGWAHEERHAQPWKPRPLPPGGRGGDLGGPRAESGTRGATQARHAPGVQLPDLQVEPLRSVRRAAGRGMGQLRPGRRQGRLLLGHVLPARRPAERLVPRGCRGGLRPPLGPLARGGHGGRHGRMRASVPAALRDGLSPANHSWRSVQC